MNEMTAQVELDQLMPEVAALIVEALNLDVAPGEIEPDGALYGDTLGLEFVDEFGARDGELRQIEAEKIEPVAVVITVAGDRREQAGQVLQHQGEERTGAVPAVDTATVTGSRSMIAGMIKRCGVLSFCAYSGNDITTAS